MGDLGGVCQYRQGGKRKHQGAKAVHRTSRFRQFGVNGSPGPPGVKNPGWKRRDGDRCSGRWGWMARSALR